MDAIKNDIYLSTIFNACEEKVLTYEELLQKVNLYTKSANFDEETLNHILEEVEKFRIHKKEYSNDEKRTYLSKLMLNEDTEKYGTKIVDSMSDAAVDKVFENEVKEIKDEDIDNIISPKKEPVKVKVRVRNEIPNIEVAKEVACDNDKLERALIETYNGVTIEEILNALIDSRKKGMTLPTTQPMEHLVMYYALKGRKGLTLDEKQRILREVKSEKARDKEIVKRVLDKINEENKKNVPVQENMVEEKQEEIKKTKKEEVLEPVDKLDKQLVRNVAGNNYYLERAILLGSFNGTKLEDILNGIINLRKNGEEIICTREMNYLVDSYAIFGKLNATILNSTLDKIANVRKEEEKKKEIVNEEKTEDKNTDANIELAKELANNSEMLEAALISKAYKGVTLELLVKALVDAKKQGISFEANEAMNALISEYEKEGKITEDTLKNVKLLLAKERLNREKGYAFAGKDYDNLDNNKGVAFAGKDLDSLDVEETKKSETKEEDKKEQQGVKFSDLSEEDFKNAERNISDAKDSGVRIVEAAKERIEKLKKTKYKRISFALKTLAIVLGLAMLGPEAGILGIGSYNIFAILIRKGKFNPKTKIGKSIKDTVIKVMGWGYSDEDKYDLLKDIEAAEYKVKEDKEKKKKEEQENKSEEKEEEKGGKTK